MLLTSEAQDNKGILLTWQYKENLLCLQNFSSKSPLQNPKNNKKNYTLKAEKDYLVFGEAIRSTVVETLKFSNYLRALENKNQALCCPHMQVEDTLQIIFLSSTQQPKFTH